MRQTNINTLLGRVLPIVLGKRFPAISDVVLLAITFGAFLCDFGRKRVQKKVTPVISHPSQLMHLQMDLVKRKSHKTLPKRGKTKQITRTESLLKRQRKWEFYLLLLLS